MNDVRILWRLQCQSWQQYAVFLRRVMEEKDTNPGWENPYCKFQNSDIEVCHISGLQQLSRAKGNLSGENPIVNPKQDIEVYSRTFEEGGILLNDQKK